MGNLTEQLRVLRHYGREHPALFALAGEVEEQTRLADAYRHVLDVLSRTAPPAAALAEEVNGLHLKVQELRQVRPQPCKDCERPLVYKGKCYGCGLDTAMKDAIILDLIIDLMVKDKLHQEQCPSKGDCAVDLLLKMALAMLITQTAPSIHERIAAWEDDSHGGGSDRKMAVIKERLDAGGGGVFERLFEEGSGE